jgi:RES domain-containing protein
MMPLPWLAGSPVLWRLDLDSTGGFWDRGIGASNEGGRWNPVGYAAVYCSADPATAILEVAVHFVVIPSAVTQESWNLIFNPMRAAGRYELDTQER